MYKILGIVLFFCFANVLSLPLNDDPFDRIVGGEDAQLGEFPFQASFRKLNIHLCGAVILNEYWVLTAAHCTDGWTTLEMTIVAGRLSKKEQEFSEQIIAVKEIHQHKKFNNVTFENDISLLKLTDPFNFNSYVNAATLPIKKAQQFSGNCIATGWGYISSSEEIYPKVLQKVSLPLISDEECRERFQTHFVADSMMCAWAKSKDACEGDSGGPLTCNGDDGKQYLGGLVSWGLGCALLRYPGVYTEVSYFLDWIDTTISANS